MASQSHRRPVIAAIPNYNMGESLRRLLPQVLAQEYDAVYVLDDCSRDNTADVLRQFPEVKVILGSRNVGAAGNRNRILIAAPQWPDALVHFIDADVHLDTPHIPRTLRQIFKDTSIGLAGGLVRCPDGRQNAFNYGPRISLEWCTGAALQLRQMHADDQQLRERRQRYARTLRAWPDTSGLPRAVDTHYVLEGNSCIPMDVLERIGGFDARLRFHEAQDLGNKIAAAGLRCRFDPSFAVTHLEVDVQGRRRHLYNLSGMVRLLHRNKWPLR